jgi:hypothetical protein
MTCSLAYSRIASGSIDRQKNSISETVSERRTKDFQPCRVTITDELPRNRFVRPDRRLPSTPICISCVMLAVMT